MKVAALALGMVLAGTWATANPLADLVIGAVMLGNGGLFEYFRGNEEADAKTALDDANRHLSKAVADDEASWYYYGAAVDQKLMAGQTALYFLLLNESNRYADSSVREAQVANAGGENYSYHRNNQKLFKGVSLTSFGVGSFFVLKAAYGYFWGQDSKSASSKKYRWARNLEVVPTADLAGAQLAWATRW